MSLPITALYAGILMIFALALSFRAGGFRGKTGISVLFGEPANMELIERVRVHQNFLEYVPMAIILMGIIAVGIKTISDTIVDQMAHRLPASLLRDPTGIVRVLPAE